MTSPVSYPSLHFFDSRPTQPNPSPAFKRAGQRRAYPNPSNVQASLMLALSVLEAKGFVKVDDLKSWNLIEM
ncbi:hypothetical protein Peur_003048 [Populus x canadensis]